MGHEVKTTALDALVEEVDVRLGKLSFLRLDTILGRCLRQYGEWAQAEIDLLCDLLPPDGVALDVGAYIGTHTLAFARRIGGVGRVHAFEPHPVFFSLLERNVAANGLSGVTLHNFGLSDRTGILAIQPVDLALEGNFGGTYLNKLLPGAASLSAQVRALDELNLDRCDLIKLDIEGMEARALEGAGATLDRCQPVVYAECNSAASGWAVIERMRRHDYDAYAFVPLAFNPDNFRASSDNFLGDAREVGLLFVAPSRRASCASTLARHRPVAPLGSLDDLVLALLKKPQYRMEIIAQSSAAQTLGADVWLSEAEGAKLRTQLDRTQLALEEAQTLAVQRHEEIAKIQFALDQVQRLALERYRELEEIRVRTNDALLKLERLRRSWKARWALALTNGRTLLK